MIAALFVARDSIYKTLDCDCYDIDRDALAYKRDPGKLRQVAD